MKALCIGYGSMGKRRIRLLKKIDRSWEILCVDSNDIRRKEVVKDGFKAFESLNTALTECPDIAFVCTTPLAHADIIVTLLEHKIPTFTELNLSSSRYDDILMLSQNNNVVLFMSNTKLYSKQIQKIKALVHQQTKPLSYMYHIGQYLPDWHPWESYTSFFAAKKESNGCREIFAIQLPWLINTFGDIERLSSISNKSSALDIPFNDTYVVSFKHKNGNIGTVLVDVVCREATTYLEVIGEEIHLIWDGKNNGLFNYNISTKQREKLELLSVVNHEDGYAENIIENDYEAEIRDFLSAVYNHTVPLYSLAKDKEILSIIDEIEK